MADFVGIDVSKKELVVAVRPSSEVFAVRHDQSGIEELATRLVGLEPSLVVMEATGGMEAGVLTELLLAGIRAVAVNPRQVRDFAKATGELAKTDRIDAQTLAHFAEAIKPEVRPLRDEASIELAELARRRQQVVDMIVREKNRIKRTKNQAIRRRIDAHLRYLTSEIDDVDRDLWAKIKATPAWKADVDLLTQVPGIGRKTATSLIALLPELGHIRGSEVSKLVGVAPLARDSGSWHGQRCIWGGRARVRTALYMATLTAVRFNEPIRAMYHRLLLAGKERKVALVACMRKLLVILNAMLRDRAPWTPQLAHART